MVPVWFCTNRKADPKGEYTKERDPDNNTYGRLDVTVEVAQNHNPSKKQGMEFKYVKKTEELFFKEINERLDTFRKLGCTPQVLVALHSYNVGFVDSLLAASHWQEDLNVAGACITFSWPSIGKSGNYEPDYAGIERSEPEILDFLVKLSASCGAEHVHLLADGMACLGLVRVLQRMATDQLDLKFGQIFLLAPDVDRDLFIDLSWLFPKYSTRTTLYASDCDRDAAKSAKRHSAPRAGLYEPYTIVDGADTVAISGLETDDLMFERKVRSYEIVTLFYDMYDLMKSDAPPSRRLHLSKQIDHGKTYWKLRKLMK
jgi:esterase/lipase superfamily enzyme